MNLATKISSLSLSNPTMLASGILGVTRGSLKYAMENGAAACVIKSISLEERTGHHAPNMITFEGGMLNAVGYSNPGVKEAKKEFINLKELPGPVIASIVGKDAEEFAAMAEELLPGEFSAVEIVLSCPHTPGYGTMAGQSSPDITEKITQAVRAKTDLPLFVKLSPDSPGIGQVAKAAEAGGADAITAGNTMGPGMILDVITGQPILDFKMGGVSGAALRPIMVRCIYDIYKSVSIPIIGCGGVINGRDAVEMMMVGASAVQVGTAIHYRGIEVFNKITKEIEDILEQRGDSSIKDIIGFTHKLEE